MEALLEVSKDFTKKYIFNKNKKDAFLEEFIKTEKKLVRMFESFSDFSFRNSSPELAKNFFAFSKIYDEFWISWGTIEFVNFGLEENLRRRLESEVADSFVVDEIFVLLSTPVGHTFYRQEEKELIEILFLPKEKWNYALKEHAKKYFWILNSYLSSQVLTDTFFRNELLRLQKEDYQKIYSEIIQYGEKMRAEKNDCMSKYSLSKETMRLACLLEQFIIMQDTRKKNNFIADHYIDFFVNDFSLQFGISVNDLRYLMFQELLLLADGGDVDQYQIRIKERKENPTIIYFKDNESWKILSSAEREVVFQSLDRSLAYQHGQLIQGIVASIGKSKYFRGRVRCIFSSKEIGKIIPGEILVTPMTAPDYIMGMKTAGAIITDEGGLTCHAAVVARELGIPCIVGTQYASKALKDGDMVEIHGGRGIIRVLNTQ